MGARGCTVIDYAFVNERILDRIVEFKVEERVDSDHLSITVEIDTEEKRRKRKGEHKKK